MGVPKLKAKAERNYRKGGTSRHCSDCNHFVPEFKFVGAGRTLRAEPRCRLIGLEPGRMYYVGPSYLCDDYDNSIKLARIKREI